MLKIHSIQSNRWNFSLRKQKHECILLGILFLETLYIFYDRNSSFAIANHVFNHGNFGNHVIEIIDPLKKYLSMKTERLVRVFYVLFPDLKHHKGLVIYTFCYIDLRKFNPFFVDVFN